MTLDEIFQQATARPLVYRKTFTETRTGKRVLCIYGARNSAPDHATKLVHVYEDPTAQDEANARLITIAVNRFEEVVKACEMSRRAMNLHRVDARAVGEKADAQRAIDRVLNTIEAEAEGQTHE